MDVEVCEHGGSGGRQTYYKGGIRSRRERGQIYQIGELNAGRLQGIVAMGLVVYTGYMSFERLDSLQ